MAPRRPLIRRTDNSSTHHSSFIIPISMDTGHHGPALQIEGTIDVSTVAGDSSV
jgi:hypothetical protein